jgi:hypothetical protein
MKSLTKGSESWSTLTSTSRRNVCNFSVAVVEGVGILVYADINIEINNNEIYAWSQAAVRVNDCDGKDWCPSPEGRMLPSENPQAVRIHDNYIHHNQHVGKTDTVYPCMTEPTH